jgi:hypothetical protein
MSRSHVVAFALVLGASGWATAQEPPQPPQGGQEGRRPASPVVTALDANNDRVIDAKEIANAATALRALDANKDGKLTMDELRPQRPGGQGGPGAAGGQGAPNARPGGGQGGQAGQGGARPQSPLMAALDANNDRVIDEKEIANAPAALKTLDKNNDGKLERDEYMPPRPAGQGGPPRG